MVSIISGQGVFFHENFKLVHKLLDYVILSIVWSQCVLMDISVVWDGGRQNHLTASLLLSFIVFTFVTSDYIICFLCSVDICILGTANSFQQSKCALLTAGVERLKRKELWWHVLVWCSDDCDNTCNVCRGDWISLAVCWFTMCLSAELLEKVMDEKWIFSNVWKRQVSCQGTVGKNCNELDLLQVF